MERKMEISFGSIIAALFVLLLAAIFRGE